MKFRVGISTPGENEHHSPTATAEDTFECFVICRAGLGTTSGMCVNPNPTDFFGLPTEIDLVFEKIRNSDVVKRHKHLGAMLPDQLNVLDEQQVIRC